MKIIIRMPNWVGDAVMALPTLCAARKAFATEHIAVMARSSVAPIFQNHPAVDKLHVITDKDSRIAGPYRAGLQIKSEQYDLGIILPPSLSSALIFKLGGVKRRVGYIDDGRKVLLTDAVRYPDNIQHRSKKYLQLIDHISGQRAAASRLELFVSDQDRNAAINLLREHGIAEGDKYICIAPRAVAPSRRWGSENYGKLSQKLTQQWDCSIVLLGTADDIEAGNEVAAIGGKKVINLCGKTSLMSAAAILSGAALFIGNDSGLGHLAAAAGSPLVILSGADNPAETSPVSDSKKVIIKDIDCISCVKNHCPEKGERFMRCMKLITVKEVLDAVQKLYK